MEGRETDPPNPIPSLTLLMMLVRPMSSMPSVTSDGLKGGAERLKTRKLKGATHDQESCKFERISDESCFHDDAV